jgi:hypothetical protein
MPSSRFPSLRRFSLARGVGAKSRSVRASVRRRLASSGKGLFEVVAPEARLHVAHGQALEEGHPGHGEGGEGVPVDQDVVGPHLLQGPGRLGQDAGRQVGEGLALLHHVQVAVLLDAEEA